MVEQVASFRIISLFCEAGAKSALLFAAPAKNGAVRAVAIKAGIGRPEQGNDAQIVPERRGARNFLRDLFLRRRQVHNAGIAGHEEVGLVKQRGSFQQGHARLRGKAAHPLGVTRG